MTARGITLNQLAAILSRLNVVSNAGEIKSGSESIRLHPTGSLKISTSAGRFVNQPATVRVQRRDCAILPRYRADSSETPSSIYHANGRRAVTMGCRLSLAST